MMILMMHVFLILSFFFHELEYTINMPSPMSLSCFFLNEINIWFFAAFVLGSMTFFYLDLQTPARH